MQSIYQAFQSSLKTLEGLVSPSICVSCHSFLGYADNKIICKPCSSLLSKNMGTINSKDLPFEPNWTRAFYIFTYSALAKKLILRYKLHNHTWLEPLFMEYLKEQSIPWSSYDFITYIPSHAEKFRSQPSAARQFSQLIAEHFNIPWQRMLARSIKTPKQSSLSRHIRQRGQRNTMLARRNHQGRVLIIDDVFTTGSTLNEGSRALIEAGLQVDVLAMSKSL